MFLEFLCRTINLESICVPMACLSWAQAQPEGSTQDSHKVFGNCVLLFFLLGMMKSLFEMVANGSVRMVSECSVLFFRTLTSARRPLVLHHMHNAPYNPKLLVFSFSEILCLPDFPHVDGVQLFKPGDGHYLLV